MTTPGIRAVGAYAPSFRIDSDTIADAWGRFEAAGIETTAVPDADEDALTMAWEAGQRALDAAGAPATDVDWLGFASTTPPLEETDLTARLGSFFGLDAAVSRQTFTGSTRAGTRALFAGLTASSQGGVSLVIASDCPRGEPADAREHAAGAGAAAFIIGPDAPARVTDRAEYATPYPGTRFRRAGSRTTEGIDITSYDRQAFRETLAGALDGLEADPTTADAVAIQTPDGELPYRAAKALGLESDAIATAATVHDLGDTGAASVPLSIATALTDDADRVAGAAFGSGAGADAFVIDVTDPVPAEVALEDGSELSYPAYLRRRGTITGGPPAGGGAYVSVPSWRRTIPQRHRLVAGHCPDCGALAFPPEGACPDCRELIAFDRVRLPDEGTVAAVTRIARGGEPPEFATQQAASGAYTAAIVRFVRDGATVALPLQVVTDGREPDVGDPATTVIRRLYEQEGVIRYSRKARVRG